jgi:hypothetical protein
MNVSLNAMGILVSKICFVVFQLVEAGMLQVYTPILVGNRSSIPVHLSSASSFEIASI